MSGFPNTKKGVKRSVPKKTQSSNTVVSAILTDEYKTRVCENSYLGRRYVINKSALSCEDLTKLYDDLLMKPVLNGPTYGVNPETYSSPYLEKNEKKYTPRFYGVERYGIPKTSKIHARGLYNRAVRLLLRLSGG
jgi:hypothetical protein